MAKVLTYPGEDELAALAEGTLRVLRGAERALNYRIVPKSGVWHDQPDQESRT
jgi:butyrate kinase